MDLIPRCRECEPQCQRLIPVMAGRNIKQYEFDDAEPVGYGCERVITLFMTWKSLNARERAAEVYATTDLDAAADRWLWGIEDAPYSSQPAFARWLNEVQAEMQRDRMQGRLL